MTESCSVTENAKQSTISTVLTMNGDKSYGPNSYQYLIFNTNIIKSSFYKDDKWQYESRKKANDDVILVIWLAHNWMATASIPVSLVYTLLIHWCLWIATTVALWDGFSTRILRSSANNNDLVHLISTNATTVFNCVWYQLINNLATHYTTSH